LSTSRMVKFCHMFFDGVNIVYRELRHGRPHRYLLRRRTVDAQKLCSRAHAS
jgi:hypothetical protein